MIVVIQCASTKQPDAGTLRTEEGRPVLFVADPDKAPPGTAYVYARPDDVAANGLTWREETLRYNRENNGNPLALLPACELYGPAIYRSLADKFGRERTYILSAGWGLIGASFLTPLYDITFTNAVKKKAPYKLCKKADRYDDFCILPQDIDEPVMFFGGKDYLSLFCRLTKTVRAPRTVFYRSAEKPAMPGLSLVPYLTARRTNWHYDCAGDFLAGRLNVCG